MRITRRLQPLALAGLIALGISSANAQTYSLNWNPRSGDVWVDAQLADVNRYGNSHRQPFIEEMVGYYGAPHDLVTDLLVNRRWAPGDVYYACTLAQVLGKPCGYVADYWQEHHGQGWGVVAQRLGIKSGSAEFHRLKRGFVPTYDRWSRPIDLDDDLRRAYPNRGKPAHAGNGGKARAKPGDQGKGKPVAAQRSQGKHETKTRAPSSPGKGNSGKAQAGKGNADKGGHGKVGHGKGDQGKGKGRPGGG